MLLLLILFGADLAKLGHDDFEIRQSHTKALSTSWRRFPVAILAEFGEDPEIQFRCRSLWQPCFRDPWVMVSAAIVVCHPDKWCDTDTAKWWLRDSSRLIVLSRVVKLLGLSDQPDSIWELDCARLDIGYVLGYVNVMRHRAKGTPLPE